MASDFESRVLRIGVIQQGRIVEERLMRKAAPVTVGTGAKSTIVLPSASGPDSITLFDAQGGNYLLIFDGTIKGRVSVGNRVVDLDTLRRERIARQVGPNWQLPLTPGSRGRLVFGDTTLLFQFVAQPEPVRQVMPASLKLPWTRRIDMPLLAILTLSFVLQGGTAGGLHVWWEQTGQYLDQPTRRSEILRPLILEVEYKRKQDEESERVELEVPEEEEVVVEAPKPPEPAPEPKPKPKVEPPPEPVEVVKVDPAEDDRRKSAAVAKLTAEEYAKARSKVESSTILRHLGSVGPGADGAFEDTLTRGVTEKQIAEAFDSSGVRVANADDKAEFRGKPRRVDQGQVFQSVSSKEIGKPQVKNVDTGTKAESKVKVAVSAGTLGPAVGTGKLDSGAVKSVFKKRKSAIRSCYEETLRSKPDAEGKVKIRFTIGPAGRITEITVVENSTGSEKLSDCIQRKVKGWRFDKPENGSVTYTYPFILSKSK